MARRTYELALTLFTLCVRKKVYAWVSARKKKEGRMLNTSIDKQQQKKKIKTKTKTKNQNKLKNNNKKYPNKSNTNKTNKRKQTNKKPKQIKGNKQQLHIRMCAVHENRK